MAYPLNGLATLHAKQGKYEQAEALYQQALHILEHVLGSDHPDLISPLNNLAIFYTEQGNYEQAELSYRQVLQICKQALGANHPDMARPLHGLAILYTEQGKYEQAEPLYHCRLSPSGSVYQVITIPMWPMSSTTWQFSTKSRGNMNKPNNSTSEQRIFGASIGT